MSISNFMNQKSFHPQNYRNQKAVWIAEEKAKAEEKRQRELAKERQTELEFTKGGASDNEKMRSTVRFMYEPPPGFVKPGDEPKEKKPEPDRPAYLKNAPTQGSYTNDIAIKVNPFGIQARNVKCSKCGAWGHKFTERECPMFDESKVNAEALAREDPLVLMKRMEDEEGLRLTSKGWNSGTNRKYETIPSEDEEDDLAWLEQLSSKEKKRLFRELEKAEKAEKGETDEREHKKKKKSKKHKSSKD